MSVTAILRTLVVTLGLLLLSPWQGTEAVSGPPPQAAAATCLAAACQPADASSTRPVRTDSSDLAILVVAPDESSQDDAFAPSRPEDGRPVEGRAISRGEPKQVLVAWTRPDGPERPPKAGSRIPT